MLVFLTACASHCECPWGGASSERGDRASRAAFCWQSLGSLAHEIIAQLWHRKAMLVDLMAYASHCECAWGRKVRKGGERARKAAYR